MQVKETADALCRAVFHSSAGHLAVVDASARVALVNDSWSAFAREIPGSRPLPGESATDPAAWGAGIDPASAAAVAAGVASTLRTHDRFRTEVCRSLPGGPQWFEVEVWPLDDAGRVVVRWTDVSARRADDTALLHASMHDDLTTLPNRFLIEERLAQASAASRRGADGLVAVLVLDIDDFTAINSAYDHAVAGEVLIGISRRLQGCVRPSDTVGRLVGDQFVIACAGYPADVAAEEIAARVIRAMEDPFRAGGHRIRISMSIGLHACERIDEAPEDMVAAAYDAMTQAKARGGGRVVRSSAEPRTGPQSEGEGAREIVLGEGYPAGEDDEGYAGSVQRLLRLLRLQVGMDVAWTSEFVGSEQVFRFVDAARGVLAPTPGTGLPLAGAYCTSVLAGTMPALIPDARSDPRGALLPVTFELHIGSYLGVPLQDADGSTRGMLCAIGGAPAPGLGQEDLNSARLIAEVLEDLHYRALHEADSVRLHESLRSQVQLLCDGEGRRAVLQPIVNIRTGEVVAAEGLTRFDSTQRGPAQWFSAAATVGLSRALEIGTGRAALDFFGRPTSPSVLAVNMSPSVVVDGGLDALLEGHDPSCVVLEVTEHAPVASYEELHDALAAYRARGLRIAVDDAGAGYASMTHVLRLRPDFLKIDMSLVRGIDADPVRLALVGALHGFAASSGATTIAEGVETEDELDALAALGVTLAQGFLFGQPGDDYVNRRR